ncbi:MAG TPA: hypothetical protein VJN88_06055 [Ktedonobacterales bacterium]|nr:hypothetical protein [Ktedonobacterales bacterium]
MVMMVNADISALLAAVAARDQAGVIRETLQLLGPEKVPPAKVAARVGIPAAWGGGSGYPLATLSVAGQVAEWMRSIPIGPEPGEDTRRALLPALALVHGFLAVAEPLAKGLPEPHPELPLPVAPADVNHEDGALGALIEAVGKRDLSRVRSILLGYYATGTDYRSVLTAMYASIATRYPTGGDPLAFTVAGSRVLDMADWGDRMPAFIYWATPLMLDPTPDAPEAAAAQTFAAAPANDLGWLRKRLSIPKEDAAGPEFQAAVVSGDGAQACAAVLRALRNGATPIGVCSALSVIAANQVNASAQGDVAGLMRAGQTLIYTHSLHAAMTQTQNPEVWPLLYTGAVAVNAGKATPGGAAGERGASGPPSIPLGGFMAASMLRTIERQIADGDTGGALAASRRYLQMGHTPRALAGVIGSVAAARDVNPRDPQSLRQLPMVAAAAEEFLTLPRALEPSGQSALLAAAIRLAAELGSGHTVADQIRASMDQMV